MRPSLPCVMLFLFLHLLVGIAFSLPLPSGTYVVAYNVNDGWRMDPYSYSLNRLSDGKSFFENKTFTLKQEGGYGFIQRNGSHGDEPCTLLFTATSLGVPQGIMERACDTLSVVQMYHPVPVINPSYFLYEDGHGQLSIGNFQNIDWKSYNDFYWAFPNQKTGELRLESKAEAVMGPHCFVADSAFDLKGNMYYLLCTTQTFDYHWVALSLDTFEISNQWPVFRGAKFEYVEFYEDKLYGFWEDTDGDLHQFGYYDLKKLENVKLDYFDPPGATYTVSDVTLLQEYGMLYASVEIFFDVPHNTTRKSVSYWLVIDVDAGEVVHLAPTGVPEDQQIDAFGLIVPKRK